MDHFIIKKTFLLKSRNKLIVSGTIKKDINKPMSEFDNLLVNNIKIPIKEVNEVLIDDYFYIAFTFDLNTLDENELNDMIELKEKQELIIF